MLSDYQLVRLKRILIPIINPLLFHSVFSLLIFRKIFKYFLVLVILPVLIFLYIYIEDFRDLTAKVFEKFAVKGKSPYISLTIFFISSTLVLYFFLYKERKEINKSILSGSIQHSFSLLTLWTAIFSFFLVFFIDADSKIKLDN